jgi:hypothetical protein
MTEEHYRQMEEKERMDLERGVLFSSISTNKKEDDVRKETMMMLPVSHPSVVFSFIIPPIVLYFFLTLVSHSIPLAWCYILWSIFYMIITFAFMIFLQVEEHGKQQRKLGERTCKMDFIEVGIKLWLAFIVVCTAYMILLTIIRMQTTTMGR